ncbi:oxidoreductase [Kribbella sp. NPDC050281]|uniref:WD40/YVTN/BNR-like repeat-containing protein n=1 Tax=Kribbella sp. NPDC050281 TaxID=3155515 RepID=UPI003405C1E5
MSSWRFMQTIPSSLIGIDVVNRDVVWASGGFDGPDESGSPGLVVRTLDGGQSWENVTPPDAGGLTFRDVRAFGRDHVLALASGESQGSRIYRTVNGGATWRLVFENWEKEAFYNGIAFFDAIHGLAMSDPVLGTFRILTTDDGGWTWKVAPTKGMPDALPDEFGRATGTCLVTKGPHDAWFGTQPSDANARVFHTDDRGRTWSVADTPIPGDPEFGIASLAFWDTRHGLALGGGDPSSNKPSVVARTTNGGRTWRRVRSLAGFRLNMAVVPSNRRDTAVAVGLTGSDITTNGGRTWRRFDQNDLRGVSCTEGACWAVGKDLKAAELLR